RHHRHDSLRRAGAGAWGRARAASDTADDRPHGEPACRSEPVTHDKALRMERPVVAHARRLRQPPDPGRWPLSAADRAGSRPHRRRTRARQAPRPNRLTKIPLVRARKVLLTCAGKFRENAMQIDRIDHLNITVADLDRSLDFYERVLGMRT